MNSTLLAFCGVEPCEVEREREREIEKFIIRQPPKGGKDDYDSENSRISDGLPSSSRRRQKEEERRRQVKRN